MSTPERILRVGDYWNNVARKVSDPHYILVSILAREKLVYLGAAYTDDGSPITQSVGVVIRDEKAPGILDRVTRNEDFITLYFATHGSNITPELMDQQIKKSDIFDVSTKETLLRLYRATRGNFISLDINIAISRKMRKYIGDIIESEKDKS